MHACERVATGWHATHTGPTYTTPGHASKVQIRPLVAAGAYLKRRHLERGLQCAEVRTTRARRQQPRRAAIRNGGEAVCDQRGQRHVRRWAGVHPARAVYPARRVEGLGVDMGEMSGFETS